MRKRSLAGINSKPIFRVIGGLQLLVGTLMLTSIAFSFYYKSGDALSFVISGGICLAIGTMLWFLVPKDDLTIRKREGYLIVAFGWLSMVLAGTLPYLISGVIPHPIDALFETVSGMTTTGASILTDIEATPKGILFWRSMTQWIGGMGIIVLTVALFPLLGIGGIELFVAEAPGPTSDKLHPRIQETAKRLWFIYVGLTLVLTIILLLLGMEFYDAINHALTTMATGGFSTKNASMAHFDQASIQYVIIFFMFLAGTNYTVIHHALRGNVKAVRKAEEFWAYLSVVLFLAAILTLNVIYQTNDSFEQSFRDSLFQVVSLITTTGYVSADYSQWGDAALVLIFVMLFLGASAGSTSGGIKLVRHIVFFKNSILEFKRLLHPRAIVPLKLNGSVVAPRIMTHIIIFLLLYLFIFVVGSIIVAGMGIDFNTAIGAVATSLGNVGPGIGKVGPVDNFAWLPYSVKFFLSFLMLLGRLELFTILVLFSPYFWKMN
jgi:trk system potassium uptake protein TrkH